MSAVKRLTEEQEKDRLNIEGTKLLYKNDYIDDETCRGIARQIIHLGTTGLSQKQNHLYRRHVLPLIKSDIKHCSCCSEMILKDESYEVIDEENTSYWCNIECYKK